MAVPGRNAVHLVHESAIGSSFVDAFTVRLAAEYFPMVRRPYSWSEYNRGVYYGGTDDDLGESMIGIPTTSPNSGHGIPAHHTSFDTPAQVDPNPCATSPS